MRILDGLGRCVVFSSWWEVRVGIEGLVVVGVGVVREG